MQSEDIVTSKERHWVYCIVMKFHHYCFAMEVSIITDHKPLATIFKNDVATLSQLIQHILPRIHQYQVIIIYKQGQELFIADWLSRHNHMEKRDEDIHGMYVMVDAIQVSLNIPECMSIQQIWQVSGQDEHLQQLKGYIIVGWPEIKDKVQQDIRTYWSFKDDMAVIDGIIMKGRHVIIPEILKTQALD